MGAMTLEGILPVPRMTARINERGDVEILHDSTPERERELAYAGRARTRRAHHCSRCGSVDHTARNCDGDGLAAARAILKARRA